MSIVSENATGITGLTSQYSAQVTGDLERNLKEQERLDAEIEALQEQLASLQHDHSILLNIQQALGIPAEPAAPEAVATVPAPARRLRAHRARASRPRPGGPRPPPRSELPRRAPPRPRPHDLPPRSSTWSANIWRARASHVPPPRSPPRSQSSTPSAPSRPPSCAPHSKVWWPRTTPSAPNRAGPSSTRPRTTPSRPQRTSRVPISPPDHPSSAAAVPQPRQVGSSATFTVPWVCSCDSHAVYAAKPMFVTYSYWPHCEPRSTATSFTQASSRACSSSSAQACTMRSQ